MARESGIVGDLRGLASTGVRAVRTRLELLALEVKEEKAWLLRFLVLAITALYLLSFAIVLGIFAIAFWASEANRPAIFAAFAAAFLAGGAGCAAYIRSQARTRRASFEDTIAVLKGDEKGLTQALRGTGD